MFNVKNKLIQGEKIYSLGSYLIGNIQFQFEDTTFNGTDVFELKIGGSTIEANYGFFKSGKITFTGINFTDLIGENKAIVVKKNETDILDDEITINSSLQMIETDPLYTSASVDLATKSFVGQAVSSGTAGLASETFVGQAVSSAVNGLASEGFVTSAITAATSGLATEAFVTSAVTGLATENYVGSAIASATTGLATETYVGSAIASATAGLATETFVGQAVSSGTAGLASETYVGSAVNQATSGLASEAYVTSAITSSIGDINAVLDNIIGSSSSAN